MTNKIKQYDTWPYLEFSFVDASGVAVDCSNYEVKLVVRDRDNIVIINDVVDTGTSGAIWTDETLGKGEYRWAEGDTDKQGVYQYEFRFMTTDNKRFTLPQEGYYEFSVYDDISK